MLGGHFFPASHVHSYLWAGLPFTEFCSLLLWTELCPPSSHVALVLGGRAPHSATEKRWVPSHDLCTSLPPCRARGPS